ncbi:hypothetical protein E7Z59_12210 [Robertkochia marina]|uniref:Four helix bundle protein n=2 Tax=Robertkochia marina TaxID=1227945 RepID=A0A4S3LZH2_9FLAO|nr:hypothetical protein [Robertkochia marina]THD66551.1 hypothetical protein E7Z59_12210 [Robertkochia marina]TRZ45609.1 hypothetical protein D3A96_06420 [Robertkochia marina]
MMMTSRISYPQGNRRAQDLPVYKKAVEIFSMSRELVRLATADKNLLDMSLSRERLDRISSSLLSSSIGLAPSIAMVEGSPDPLMRIKSLRFLQQETGKLQRYCEQIDSRLGHSKTFVKRLQNEIVQFRKLQSHWVGRLRELN